MPRIVSLDLARGFAVLFIAPIHTVLLFGNPSVMQSWLPDPLLFIAEGIGPGIFLIPMGFFIALKPNVPFKQVLKRSAFLLLAGYALNILKFILPRLLFGLPPALEQELQIAPGWTGYTQLFMIGDILHFAALAIPFGYLIMRQFQPLLHVTLYSLIFLIAAPWLWDQFHGPLQLFTGHPPQTFFPFVDWIVYPLTGLLFGRIHRFSPYITFSFMTWAGGCLTLFGWSVQSEFPYTTPYGMYRMYPGATIMHIGIVLLTLVAWHQVHRRIPPNHVFKLLTYSSRHITAIYGISWILITACIPIIGYRQTGLAGTIALLLMITGLTYLLTHCFKKQ